MNKEALKNIIDLVPEKDIETIYKVVIKFIPETEPLPDEVVAIMKAEEEDEMVDHDSINWD